MASRDDAIDAYLGTKPEKAPRGIQTREQAIKEFFAQQDRPLPKGEIASALENLKNLPKLVTEGLPAAGRAFVQSQGEPTYGTQLAQKYPKSLYTPIPGILDVAGRMTRLPQSVGRALAELGPEQAKPLTEAAGSQLPFLPWMSLRRPAPGPVPRIEPYEPPALPPGQAARALGPSQQQPRPPGPAGRAYVYDAPSAASPALQDVVERGKVLPAEAGASSGPKTAMTWQDLEAKAKTFRTAEDFKSYALRTPSVRQQLRERPVSAEDFYREATAPKVAPEPPVARTPAPSVEAPAAPAERPALPPAPKAPTYERTPEGMQGVIGGTPEPELKLQGQESDVFKRAKSAAREREMAAKQGEIPTSGPPEPSPSRPARPFFGASSREYESGQPSLSDPADLYHVVKGFGGIRTTGDLAGELRDIPAWAKSKNGATLDDIAARLVDNYPALGERGAVKEELIAGLRGYDTLKEQKAARAAAAKAAEAEAAKAPVDPMVTEIRTEMPPADIAIDPADWKAMGPLQRKSAIEYFRDSLVDESGRLDLKRMADALKKFADRFPKESAVRRDNPNSPVISEVERWSVGLADGLQMVADQDWWKQIRKINPETLKDVEEQMVNTWKAGGGTAAAKARAIAQAPPEVQAAMRHRDLQFQKEQVARRYFGLEDIPEQSGPYLPRRTDKEAREAVSLGGGPLGVGRGRALQSTVRGHGQERVFETYRQGEKVPGVEYEDPRNSILMREWEGLKLRSTYRLFKNLEAKGALFRDQAQARAASPTQHPWRVNDAPGGGTWWTPTEAEAKFLEQNLTESAKGNLGSLVGYANGLMRNPNLINPLPHFAKNMGFKLLLARGPVTPYVFAKDAVEWARGTNPQMLREFREAMPFSEGGRTAGDVLGSELRGGTLEDGIRTAMRTVGKINRPSQKVIFEWGDPAMRYSLYKHYREQGKGVYEAGNHAWVDLIRYGTRSKATDFWKSMPLNFFVPWRFGTVVSLLKQAGNHPVRTALLLGAIEYLREVRYRATGKFTHLPYDYAAKPIAQMIDNHEYRDALAVLGTTAAFGPGGDFSAKQIGDVFLALQGKPNALEVDRLKNAFWGISQIYNLPAEFAKGDYAGMLATAILGEHNAVSYQPRRLGRYLPESLPGMQKSAVVQEAERQQAARDQRRQQSEERRKTHPTQTIEDRLRAQGLLR